MRRRLRFAVLIRGALVTAVGAVTEVITGGGAITGVAAVVAAVIGGGPITGIVGACADATPGMGGGPITGPTPPTVGVGKPIVSSGDSKRGDDVCVPIERR